MQSSSERIPHQNPKARANCFSQICFGYTIPIFRHGWKKGFTEDDLYEVLPQYRSEMLGDQLQASWNKELTKDKPSLYRALRRIHLNYFLKFYFLLIFVQLVKISQAISLFYLMKYFEKDQSELDENHAYLCAICIVIPSFIVVMCMHGYMLSLQHLGMMARIACCSLVYRKCLRLSRKSLEDATIGQMVNLISNDVNRFDYVCLHMPYMFEIPVELAVSLVLLYYFGSIHPFAGVALFVLLIPIQIILGGLFSRIRGKTAIRTDERVRLMSEVLSGIEVIKMHTWEQSFADVVSDARKHEIRQIRWSCYVKALLLSLTIITSRVAVFLALLVYVLYGNKLSAQFVFLVVALFGVLRQSMTIALPNAISQMAETRVTIRRLEAFLLSEENWSLPLISSVKWTTSHSDIYLPTDVHIILRNVSAKWGHSVSDNVLTDVSFELGKRDMMAVIGMVGSGKSSLLNLLLKELPITSGELDVVGDISYAAQEPWLFGGSIKQNILFGQGFEHNRYNKVLTVCALKRDLSLLPYGDDTIIGERGVSLSGGQRARVNLARAIYKEADIYLLDDPLSAVDTKVGNVIFEDCIMEFLQGKCVILATHQLQYLRDVSIIMMLQSGQVSFLGDYDAMVEAKPELVSRIAEKVDTGLESAKQYDSMALDLTLVPYTITTTQLQKETFGTGAVKSNIYRAYMTAGGNCCVSFIIGVLFLLTQVLASACDYFISFWVNVETLRALGAVDSVDEFGYELQNTDTYIWFYSGLMLLTVIVTLVRSIAYFSMCMQASIHLHKNMFYAVVSAPMAFFNKQPSGRILNRFSKDMGTIDDQFPYVTLDTFQIGLSVLGIIVVTVVINPFIMIPMGIILIIFYLLRVYYLHTSRNLKRLEGITRSPVFTHLNATMQGLSTIRAFNTQEASKQAFDHYQDLHTSAFDTYLVASRAFGFLLDLICCIFITLVVFSFLIFFTDTHGANVGLAITQALMLTGMFQWGMRQWSEMDNNMTSVERIYEYTQIIPETSTKSSKTPPPYWPLSGAIEFKNVYLKYSRTEPYVLRDLNFKVKTNQKIGIVGRTGAGKSSIIASLFQLADTEGQIIIDNIDIQTIPLKNLRSKIAIIPQEPVLFAGTLRKNLDPFQEHSDTLLWKALEDVALLPTVLKLPAGLESLIYEGGANFSVGQRQLLCLARAIVRSNRILVLDEATANVDPQTDDLIQTTIREKFRFCTVLTIAHRLHTILDADKVLVMEAGRAKEFGYSYVLLQNTDGIFYSLVQSSGPHLRDEIFEIAKQNYFMRLKKGLKNPPKPLDSEEALLVKDVYVDASPNPSGPSAISRTAGPAVAEEKDEKDASLKSVEVENAEEIDDDEVEVRSNLLDAEDTEQRDDADASPRPLDAQSAEERDDDENASSNSLEAENAEEGEDDEDASSNPEEEEDAKTREDRRKESDSDSS